MRKLTTLLLLALVATVFVSCDIEGGESYVTLPEAPKVIFRGGIGKITIRYVPPPDPIFRISNAMDYIEFKTIKDSYGVPDKPLIIEYTVETSVLYPNIRQRTESPQFNDYALRVVQSWKYTRFGTGSMKVAIDVAKKKITVDASQIRLVDQEPGRPAPKIGNVRELVRQNGFTVVAGTIY